jgi:hypothetical protein
MMKCLTLIGSALKFELIVSPYAPFDKPLAAPEDLIRQALHHGLPANERAMAMPKWTILLGNFILLLYLNSYKKYREDWGFPFQRLQLGETYPNWHMINHFKLNYKLLYRFTP